MKALKKIKDILFFILGVVFFAFAICITILLLNYNDYGVTQFGDTSLIIINNEIASDKYKKGDLVIVESNKIENIKVGEDIFTYKLDGKGAIHIDQGVVGKIYEDEKAISFENGDTYSEEFIAGTPTKVYNKVGKYLSIVSSKWGFLFIILVPSFLLFIYEIYALIIEIKYGKDEEEEEVEEKPKKTEKTEKKEKAKKTQMKS